MASGWLVTHKDCLDGATAGLIGLAVGLTPVFTEPDRVTAALAAIPDDRPVYLADVSIPVSDWPRWGPRITALLDHHQTALPLASQPGVRVDVFHCGSLLLYDFAQQRGWMDDAAPWQRLTSMVQRYDLWLPEHQAGQNLNRLLHELGWQWYCGRFGEGWTPYLPEEADRLAQVIRGDAKHIAEAISSHIWADCGRVRIAGVAQAPDEDFPINEVSHRLLQEGYQLVVVLKPDGRLSARSDASIDAAVLMQELFAGGGHPRAAGGRLPTPDMTLSEVLRVIRISLAGSA